jgi:amino acid permease
MNMHKSSTPISYVEKHVRRAAVVIVIALVGTLASLMTDHPLSFIEFMVVGLFLMVVAIIYYLISLIREPRRTQQE